MPTPPVRLHNSRAALAPAFDAIRAELGIEVDFDAAVMAEADEAARSRPRIAAASDRRDVPLVTIDPPGSRDLDQALAIERRGRGFVVWYAIADVAAFVVPGGAVDRAARERGVTVYLPDRRAPLHPPVLSEGAASLLPGVDRQALLWRFELDADAVVTSFHLERARVRSRAALSYEEAHRDGAVPLLALVGPLREHQEAARGGVALNVPDQVVTASEGGFDLAFRAPLPIEGWNAQISLMTGMQAAAVMLDTGVGILRTLPAATADDVAVLRRHARALHVEWPAAASYADVVRALDPRIAAHAALLAQAARLFRGAGYHAFDVPRGVPVPPKPAHAAVAAPYAHVTAPLRRLVDRFANELVLAAVAGEEPPGWARDALPELPALMEQGRRREGAADARANDVVEAAVLQRHVGAQLEGVVVRTHSKGAQVQIADPAVVATVPARDLDLGQTVRLRVLAADPPSVRVDLAVVP